MASSEYVVLRTNKVAGGAVLGGAPTLGAGATGVAEVLTVQTVTLGAGELLKQPGVVSIAKKMPVTLVKPFDVVGAEASDSTPGATWGLTAIGALSSQRTGAGVTVAVLDTGIRASHEAFVGKTIVEEDFTGEGNGDLNGHGTHCAGTICGGPVGGRRIGVAPGVQRILVGKVLDRDGAGSTEQILDGLIWAARQGANVISMSLGLDFPGFVARLLANGFQTEEATSIALEAYRQNVRLFDSVTSLVAAQSAMFSKCIIVAASGNESKRPQYEVAAAPPSAADGILAVGAVGRTTSSATSNFEIANFSNSGPAVSGPGVAILSAGIAANDSLVTLSGTSMATPHVAGVAALWFEELAAGNPQFRIGELDANLKARALKNVFAAGVDPDDRGAGLVQAPQP